MIGSTLILILLMSVVAFFVGRSSGRRFVKADGVSVHSRPSYHGLYVAVWVGIPAALLALLWVVLQG